MKASIDNHNAKMHGEGESAVLSPSKSSAVVIKKGYSPYVGTNGNWFEYSEDEKRFIDTGVRAEGRQGERGRDGVNGQNGRDGIDGKTPVKGVDYFDGRDGRDGVDGQNGRDGRDGVDGYTPRKGVDYFDGQDGKDGKDGKTPVKGVDYFDGKKGDKGDKGDSYIITDADYQAIADKVPTTASDWASINNKPDTFPPSEHSHSQYLTEHQSLEDCVKTNDSRLTDARTPKAHSHTKSEITDFPTVPTLYGVDGLHTDGAFTQKYVSEALKNKADTFHTHEKLSVGDNYLELIDGKGIRYDDGDDYYYVAMKSDIPTDAHINDLIDAKLGVIENGSY